MNGEKAKSLRFLDTSLNTEKRVSDLISRMTLEEKVSQMVNRAPAIERLEVPAYNWSNECLHGVARAGVATVFPQAIGLAATWDIVLIRQIAEVISDEARAKHHEAVRKGQRDEFYGLTFWSPNINIFRDPRWGRGQETFGEDPFLTARMGVAFVNGLQGDDPHYLKLVATPKHFAVHSGPEMKRHQFNAQVDEHDLRETYLPAFEACVREAQAVSIMGAYNRTNGEPCCASFTLLEKILRQEWGFEGYVVSDCGAIADIYRAHQVVESPAHAAALAVSAGCDLNCGKTYSALLEAVEEGLISEAAIDRSVKRLFTARFRLGMFDPPEEVPYAQIPIERNDSPEHRALALKAALESMVLLQNKGGLLPLEKSLGTIAVIGPNADDEVVLLGNYFGTPSRVVTPLAGIRARAPSTTAVVYTKGCGIVKNSNAQEDENSFREAIDLAREADLVIYVAGLSQSLEGEENQQEGVAPGKKSEADRNDLELPGVQERLLIALHATGTPLILVLLNGSPVAVSWAKEHVPAILEVWYPGEEGGTAIAQVLFGDYNPAGRLPVTFYRETGDLPEYEDYQMAGRTYRYFQGEALFPFGYGLSYTDFTYENLRLSSETLPTSGFIEAAVEVKNAGRRAGDEVVQCYLSNVAASVPVPLRQLAGFQRIHLEPGETARVSFTLNSKQMAWVDSRGQRVIEPGEFRIAIGGRQPQPEDFREGSKEVLTGSFTITGERTYL